MYAAVTTLLACLLKLIAFPTQIKSVIKEKKQTNRMRQRHCGVINIVFSLSTEIKVTSNEEKICLLDSCWNNSTIAKYSGIYCH